MSNWQQNYDTMTPGKEEQLERLLQVEKMSPKGGGVSRIVRWRRRPIAETRFDRGLSIHKGSSRMSLGQSSGETG